VIAVKVVFAGDDDGPGAPENAGGGQRGAGRAAGDERRRVHAPRPPLKEFDRDPETFVLPTLAGTRGRTVIAGGGAVGAAAVLAAAAVDPVDRHGGSRGGGRCRRRRGGRGRRLRHVHSPGRSARPRHRHARHFRRHVGRFLTPATVKGAGRRVVRRERL